MVDIEALLKDVNPPYFANSKWQPGNPVYYSCLLYTSPSPRDQRGSRMPSSA